MTEVRIPLDGWEDDAGQQMFIVEAEGDTVRMELPSGRYGVVNIWPSEARALAEALRTYADEAEVAPRSGEQPPPPPPGSAGSGGGTNERRA
jgi:hypothetical protein